MTRLHQLFSCSAEAVSDLMSIRDDADSVLLADRGVQLLASGSPGMTNTQSWFALTADVEARGLQAFAAQSGIDLISDEDWIELVSRHEQVLSWK